MRFLIKSDDGMELDAAVQLESAAIIVLSRGGTSGTSNSQNQDYPVALRLILQRLAQHQRPVTGAWVDSAPAQLLPLAERQILFPNDMPADAKILFSLLGRRMEAVGRSPGSPLNKGNRNKRLRIEVGTNSIGELASVIGATALADVPKSALRLPAADLRKVSEAHIWSALELLRDGATKHPFENSLDYDFVNEDGARYPPKAVFGIAASLALGFPVQPANFTGGVGTVCFDVLETAGWQILPKGAISSPESMALNSEDREWAEGDARRLTHLRRERHAGVAKAKKAQMRQLHGKLYCEECGMNPVAVFGDAEGEACIEVHHRDTGVAQMSPGHVTKLADVECLCANCHRVRHRRMKNTYVLQQESLLRQ